MLDAARLADELRAEQENTLAEEKGRKSLGTYKNIICMLYHIGVFE